MVLDHQTSVHMNLGGGKERRSHRQQHQIFTSQQKDSSKSSSNETLDEEISKWREERKKRFPKLEAKVVEKSVPNCENEKKNDSRIRGRGVGEEEGEASVASLLLSSPHSPVTRGEEEPDSDSTPFVGCESAGIRSSQQANNRRRRNREKRSKGRVRMDQSFDDAKKRRRVTLFQKVTSVRLLLLV